MVDDSGESFLDAEYRDHGKWVTTGGIIEDHKWLGYLGHDTLDLEEDNRWEDINDHLFNYQPYFCETLVPDFFASTDEETEKDQTNACKESVRTMMGDALAKADAIKMVFMEGDYYGDWEKTLVIFSDYETKETMTLVFDTMHEI